MSLTVIFHNCNTKKQTLLLSNMYESLPQNHQFQIRFDLLFL